MTATTRGHHPVLTNAPSGAAWMTVGPAGRSAEGSTVHAVRITDGVIHLAVPVPVSALTAACHG